MCFFARGLELFQGTFFFVDDRLKIFLGGGKFQPQPGGFSVVMPRCFALRRGSLHSSRLWSDGRDRVLEQDQEVAFLGRRRFPERDYVDLNRDQLAAAFDPQAVRFGRGAAVPGGLDGFVQTHYHPFTHHFQDVMTQLSSRQLEIGTRSSPDLHDVHGIVDDDACRGIFRQGQPVGFSLHVPSVLSNSV